MELRGGDGTEGVCLELKGTRFGFKVYDLSTVDSEQVHITVLTFPKTKFALLFEAGFLPQAKYLSLRVNIFMNTLCLKYI